MAHHLVEVARQAIRRHLASTAPLAVEPARIGSTPWGVFVSLHGPGAGDVEGPLRGCIGSLDLHGISLEEEVARVAVSSATADPRFPPLRGDEVDELDVTVYLLDRPGPVDGPEDLDPDRFGVLVTGRGGRRALLLPGIPGIETGVRQLELVVRKAGMDPDDEMLIERFAAEVLH